MLSLKNTGKIMIKRYKNLVIQRLLGNKCLNVNGSFAKITISIKKIKYCQNSCMISCQGQTAKKSSHQMYEFSR